MKPARKSKGDTFRATDGSGAQHRSQSDFRHRIRQSDYSSGCSKLCRTAKSQASQNPSPSFSRFKHLLFRLPEGRREERVRLSRRRRTIATRLVEAQHNAAMLTTYNEIDMSAVMELRKRHKESFQKKHGVGLGIVSFFVKASVGALKEFPQINSELQEDELLMKYYYDIGVAIGAEEGLVVPVLRDADRMSFAQIEQGDSDFRGEIQSGHTFAG